MEIRGSLGFNDRTYESNVCSRTIIVFRKGLKHRWQNRGDKGVLAPPLFFRGGLNLRVYFTIIPLHECIGNEIGLSSKLKPRKSLIPETFSLEFCLWGGRTEKVQSSYSKKINLRLVNIKLSILHAKGKPAIGCI